jgi:FkbM family methyltransferase
VICKSIGLERYSGLFLAKLMSCYGRPIDESRVAFYIPGTGQLILPSDAGWIVEEVFIGEVYDRCFEFASNSIILDIGAHAGAFSVKIAKRVNRGFVLAIEPHPSNFNLLIQNISINKLRNVMPLNLALSGKMGKIRLYLNGKSYIPSTFFRKGRWLEVPTDSLDNVIRRLGLERVDFIKIDAEGAALDILKSGENILQFNGLKLSIAAYHTRSESRVLTEFLKAKGFAVWSTGDYLYALNES